MIGPSVVTAPLIRMTPPTRYGWAAQLVVIGLKGLVPPNERFCLPLAPPTVQVAPPSTYPLPPHLLRTLHPQVLYTGIVIYAPALILNQGLTGGQGGVRGGGVLRTPLRIHSSGVSLQ